MTVIMRNRNMLGVTETLYEAGYRKQSESFSRPHENDGEWMSVEDRLPEKGGLYLVYTTLNLFEVDTFQLYEEEDMPVGCWWELQDYVTHWMPLPEPPKMKQN